MQPRREGMIWQIVGLLVVIAAALEIRSAAQQFTATFSQKYAGEMDIDEERAPLGPLREAAHFSLLAAVRFYRAQSSSHGADWRSDFHNPSDLRLLHGCNGDA